MRSNVILEAGSGRGVGAVAFEILECVFAEPELSNAGNSMVVSTVYEARGFVSFEKNFDLVREEVFGSEGGGRP